MKIEIAIGQYIKVFFRHGGLILEGLVESWEPDNCVLRSLTDDSLIIIHSPQDDIMVIKVMPIVEPVDDHENDLSKQTGIKIIPGTLPKINDASKKLDKIDHQVVEDALGAEELTDMGLRAKKLAELHLMKINAEREIIANKLKDHNITETRKIEYGLPGFLSKPSSK